MKKIVFTGLMALGILSAYAQCDSTNHAGNLIISSDMFLSGTLNVTGTFQVNPGVTVYILPYSTDNCGKLTIYAQKIKILGNINGDFSGYPGGAAGGGGTAVSSTTGDMAALDNCSNKDNTGHIMVQGGQGGTNGLGTGAGLGGGSGTNGSGPKQQCLSVDDEAGMIGSGGGAGGGGGAGYGGSGSAAQTGGNGTDYFLASGLNVSTGFVVLGGAGGAAGAQGAGYGTMTGGDIDAGSGGAGSGGGGRSFETGLQGGTGGNGGAMVKLVATDSLRITGNISVNGEDGKQGGFAGNGGQSPKCCSDGCDDCGETTLSCGAGGGSGSGGGSGGGILLISDNHAHITGNLNANGGNGGNGGSRGYGATCTYDAGVFCGSDQTLTSGDGSDGKRGGAGGGGRIKVFVNACSPSTVTPFYSVNGGTSFTNAATGTYYFNCTATSMEENLANLNQVDVYPNPTNNLLNIEFSAAWNNQDISIHLVNINGETVYTSGITTSAHTQIDVSNLANGLYLLHITSGQQSMIKKIIKQ